MSGAVLELAKTGRSKCATTGTPIEQGSPRVGFEIWRVGRRCMTYQTPKAFLKNLELGALAGKASKCKFSGADLSPGDLFVAFRMGGAKGEKVTSQYCKLDKVNGLLGSVVQAAGGKFSVQGVLGFKGLSAAHQKAAVKAFACKKKSAPSSASEKRAAGALASASKRAKK